MRVWFDALTPKQLLLFSYIAKRLKERNAVESILLTTRYTDEINRLNRALPFKAEIVGTYGKNKVEKLKADALRVKELADIIEAFDPDLLVSYPSPSATRVAFGLGIKIAIITDTPHAEHVNRLTLPLANWLIFSIFINKSEFASYVHGKYTKILRYRGIEEIEWISNYVPNRWVVERYGLEPYKYVVMRPAERYAAYYKWKDKDPVLELIRHLPKELGVALFPRYEEDDRIYAVSDNVKIIKGEFLALDFEYFSIATVTGGGTMARESALLGVPAITLFPGKISLHKALAELGFPIYRAESTLEAINLMSNIIDKPESYRKDTSSLIKSMELPSGLVERLIKNEFK